MISNILLPLAATRQRKLPPATADGGGAQHTDHPSPQHMQACLWHTYVGGHEGSTLVDGICETSFPP